MNPQIITPKSNAKDGREMLSMLVQLVKQHPELYNPKSKNYEDQVLKNNIWNTIGKQLNWPENECRIKWKQITAIYKQIRNKSTQVLDDESQKVQNNSSLRLEFLDEVDNNDDIQSQSSGDEESEVSEYGIFQAIQGTKRQHQESVEQKKHQAKIQRLYNKNHLAEEIKTRQEQTNALIKELLEKTSPQNDDTLDPALSLFFQSITSSVSKFTPQLKARAKGEIMNIISQLEILNINQQQILKNSD